MPLPTPSPTVLVTGFEPFDGDALNPSWEVARALDGWACAGHTVRALQLPCVFGLAAGCLAAALDGDAPPRLVVGLGLAGGRTEWTPERVAINCNDARIADNAGARPIDTAVVSGGPAAYFSTLPIKAIVQALRDAGLPAGVSNTAGTFVCNHSFYALMHLLATRPALAGTRGGFVHVPALPGQAVQRPGMPSMALADQVDALRVTLRTALETASDLALADGQTH